MILISKNTLKISSEFSELINLMLSLLSASINMLYYNKILKTVLNLDSFGCMFAEMLLIAIKKYQLKKSNEKLCFIM